MRYAKLYPENTLEKLEFNRILELLNDYCLSELGRGFVQRIRVSADYAHILKTLQQVNEMKYILDHEEAFPADNYLNLEELFSYLEVKNAVLSEEQFLGILLFLLTVKDIFDYLNKRAGRFPQLEALLKGNVFENDMLSAIADVITQEGEVRPGVSPVLDKIRKDLKAKEKELDKKFNSLLSAANANGWLASGSESIKNGRRVLTVLSEYKRRIKGIIHDESATGKTVFIEPEETIEISNDHFELKQEERREIQRILRELTAEIQPYAPALRFYQSLAGLFDFIRAKALLAVELRACLPEIKDEASINLMKAFHPLLFIRNRRLDKPIIPINLKLDEKDRILLVSGPNAGGKSVTLKTVGLLQIMLQSGMLVPVFPDTRMGIFKKIFVELGDEQSIENDLSTYSSRLTHMKFFLSQADSETLFFIDEFGTGTDPKFGGAIAEALLEELNNCKSFGVINTHYSNLKLFATNTPGIINGSMAFNKETLTALYELRIGQPGSSHAFEIAKKIGLPAKIIANAKEKMDQQYHNFDSILSDLESEKFVSSVNSKRMEKDQKQLEALIASYTSLKEDLEKNKKKILLETKQKSLESLEASRKKFEQMIKEFQTQGEEKTLRVKIQNELQNEKEVLKQDISGIKQEKKKDVVPAQIEKGSAVKLHEGSETGIVEEIRNNRALVGFGNLRTLVPIEDLELVDTSASRAIIKKGNIDYQKIGEDFSHTLDLRGMRADDALREVENQLDKALLLGFYTLRILHGKGDGILRRKIREMLKKFSYVKDFRSEMPEAGGDGVTVVNLE